MFVQEVLEGRGDAVGVGELFGRGPDKRARIFGDIDDPESEVSRLINTTHTERLFTELGTDPQIYYIPEMGGGAR